MMRSVPARADASDGVVPLDAYTPTALTFRRDPLTGAFVHQYDRDLQLLCVWGDAREHDDAIRALAEQTFDVVAEFEVTWSAEHVVTNFERLYAEHLHGTSDKHEEVGTGPFLLLVLEDRAPRYAYRRNVSGLVELTSVHMSALKAQARARAGGYRVHSSNGLQEFFRDATLLLGPDHVDAILAGTAAPGRVQVGDPVGTGGWSDLAVVFRTLRRAVPYVVLRGFDDLPRIPEDREVDVLGRRRLDLGALLGARPDWPGGAAFRFDVDGERVTFDVRTVRDGYLDAAWQERILARRSWHDDVPVPREDDLFFSLLYHAKIQKPSVKPAYVPQLLRLAKELDLPDELGTTLFDDDTAAAVLDGYLAAHGYGVPIPADPDVHRNDAVVARLWRTRVEPPVLELARRELWARTKGSPPARFAARSSVLRSAYRTARSAAQSVRGRFR
jgi:hypothetical protein